MEMKQFSPDDSNNVERSQLNSSESTIFVVDDDESLRRSLSRLLHSAGWNVETFSSAHNFLKRSANYVGTGCVLLDVQMPEMSGPDLHDQLSLYGISLPVIFLTAHGDVTTSVQAMKKGAADFLEKPIDDVSLLGAIQRAIERHDTQQLRQHELQQVETCLSRLSPREREVLDYVINGYLNKQIADKMGISIKTVKVHRARVMEKMEIHSVAALVHRCEIIGMTFSQAGT